MEPWIAPEASAERASHHATMPLRDMMSPRREPVLGAAGYAACSPITVHLNGGISIRDREASYKGSMFAAYPGDVVFSKIDARSGAIGVVPEGIAKAVVTPEFPVFVPDPGVLDGRFVQRVLRTGHFLGALRAKATGTSGRKRITPESFLDLRVPLPAIAEQQRMVKAFDGLLADASLLSVDADKVEADAMGAFEVALGYGPPPALPDRPMFIARFANLDRWTHGGILRRTLNLPDDVLTYSAVPLSSIGKVSYGLQKFPGNRPGLHARPYLRVANVQRWELDLRIVKTINVPDAEMPRFRLQDGDVLLCEGNSADLVGRGAIWRGEIADCVHQNHVLRVRLDQGRALPEFVLAVINSAIGQAYFRSKAKRTTNLASINSKEVAALPVPLPPIDVQRDLVAALHAQRTKAADMRRDAAGLRAKAAEEFEAAVYGEAAPLPLEAA